MSRYRNLSNRVIFDIQPQAELTPAYLALMAISGVLTAVALLTNSVAVLIGAMVVAPALPPLALFMFGVAGGQPRLGWGGLGTLLAGLLIAMAGAVGVTLLMRATGLLNGELSFPSYPLLEERVRPGWYSFIAAFAAGIAAVVGTAKKKVDTLIGVVAAVALVPAGAAAAIAMVEGDWLRTAGGVIMLVTNVMVIIAAGFITIVISRPQATPGNGTSGATQMSPE